MRQVGALHLARRVHVPLQLQQDGADRDQWWQQVMASTGGEAGLTDEGSQRFSDFYDYFLSASCKARHSWLTPVTVSANAILYMP